MTAYFLDSSALVKRYVAEPGTAWVRAIGAPSAGNSLLVSQIAPAEVISGVARRRREGVITPRAARAIRLLLDQHMQHEYQVVVLTTPLIWRSQDLLEQYPLRAYDAIQLASALEGNARLLVAGLMPLIFVSADTRLLTVATAASLPAENPNAHA